MVLVLVLVQVLVQFWYRFWYWFWFRFWFRFWYRFWFMFWYWMRYHIWLMQFAFNHNWLCAKCKDPYPWKKYYNASCHDDSSWNRCRLLREEHFKKKTTKDASLRVEVGIWNCTINYIMHLLITLYAFDQSVISDKSQIVPTDFCWQSVWYRKCNYNWE